MRQNSELVTKFWENGKVNDCPIIDIHGHMGNWMGIYFPKAEPAEIVNSMDRAGVKMVVFSHHSALSSPDVLNSKSIEAVRKFPDRLKAYCVINPNYPDIVEREINTYEQYKDIYVGLKFHTMHGISYDDQRYKSTLEFADDMKLIVLVHSWGGSSQCGDGVLRKVASTYKNIKLIVGHSLHNKWDEAVKIAMDFDNVYLDLCAVMDERNGVLEKFVNGAGSEKVLFGTDIPWFGFHYYIGSILAADITDEDRRNIFYRNAGRLLGR